VVDRFDLHTLYFPTFRIDNGSVEGYREGGIGDYDAKFYSSRLSVCVGLHRIGSADEGYCEEGAGEVGGHRRRT
jgi:hypothetical protein